MPESAKEGAEMAVKTGDEYVASIKKLNLKAHIMGEKVADVPEHPLVAPSLRAVAATFDCALRRVEPRAVSRSLVADRRGDKPLLAPPPEHA